MIRKFLYSLDDMWGYELFMLKKRFLPARVRVKAESHYRRP